MGSKLAEYIIIGSVLGLVGLGYFYNQAKSGGDPEEGLPQLALSPEVKQYVNQQVNQALAGDTGVQISKLLEKVIDLERSLEKYDKVIASAQKRLEERKGLNQLTAKARQSREARFNTVRAIEAVKLKTQIIRSCGNLPAANNRNNARTNNRGRAGMTTNTKKRK